MSLRILLTEPDGFSERALGRLRSQGFDPVPLKGPLRETGEILEGFDGVIVRLGMRFSRKVLQGGARLRFIASPTTGLDHIDLDAAREGGVEIVSLRGMPGLGEITSTAEHAFGLLLSLVRNTCPASRSVLDGNWDRDRFVGRELKGKTAGVMGMGRLGKMFAGYARAFHMEVLYYDPAVDDDTFEGCTTVRDLATRSDVVSLHIHLDEGTRGLLGRDYFSVCRQGQFIVNTARGGLIDEKELLRALESGRAGGAALDVLCGEPGRGRPLSSPLLEYARKKTNLLITPHVGGASFEAMRRTEEMIADEIVRRFGRG